MNLKSLLLAGISMLATVPMASKPTLPVLWYQQPAPEWMEAVPIGNGRLGASVYGGIDTDRIALNEITMWAGQRDEEQNDHCGPEKLAEIRKAFFAGDLEEGNRLTNEYLHGFSKSFGTHLPLGDIVMEFTYPDKKITDYRRELNLQNAVAKTTFKSGDVTYTREYICDYPDDVMAVLISADRPGAITMALSTDLLRKSDINVSNKGIFLTGKVDYPMFGPGGVEFAGDFRVLPKGGKMSCDNKSVKVTGADEVLLLVDVRTDFDNPDYKTDVCKTVDKAASLGFKQLKHNHTTDHSALFNRMEVDFGDSGNSHLPTDTRLHLAKNGTVDPDFDALFFQYGRYMQIASSRPNSPLCSNLQGIWNDNLACQMSWTCDYHLDININQNYWSPNKANLAECNEPMFKYVKLLEKYGSETASKLYGARGWCAHTVTNPWGYTAPGGDVSWGLNVTGGAWLATELWSHYLFTKDEEYLRNTGYPLLKSCAEFFVDYMVEDPNTGYLVTGPSISPENGFRTTEGKHYSASMMPTLDRSIVEQIYTACIEGSKVLGVDKKFRQQLEKDIKRLPPYQIDKNGHVAEWMAEGVERSDPAHRHSSHLMSLYPFGQLSYTKTPELMKAAAVALEAQTSAPGWENTEWSCGNMLGFYSFLKDGEKCHDWLMDLFHNFTRENLMTVSPKGVAGAPADIFSFDATEASVAAMCDMIIQSHDGFIEFLPALPSVWATGKMKGVCAQGGLVADVEWRDSNVTTAKINATKDHSFNILLPENSKPEMTLDGTPIRYKVKDGKVNVAMKAGQNLAIDFTPAISAR